MDIEEKLEDGTPVLFSANDFGLPAIQDVEGAEHMGFGHFIADVGEGSIAFDAGGAMRTLEKDGERIISWTPVVGEIDTFVEEFGYDFEDVKEKVKNI